MKNKPRKWALVAFLSALFVFAPIAGIEAVQNAIPMVAAEEAVAEETAVQNGVAKVGDTEYATIDEAIANWTNGTTLTLLSDVTLSDVIQLSSTEYHILDLGTYTMTAASGKDAIQYVVNGRTSASYALDIKADATNPGGITATGKTVVSHIKPSSNVPTSDRPITRFYGGVFNASYVVKQGGTNSWGFLTSGYTGASAPYFQFYGGEYNGTIYTNRSQNQFYGGVFNGSMQMSVDSSAYTQVAGGTFKNLSNSMGSTLNSDKFVIGTAKGANNGSVCIDENGNYVVTTTTPTAAEASVASNYNSNNYFYYSTVNTNGMYYEDVYDALEANATGTVTVFTEELDLEGSSFKGIIVVPEGKTITIITAADENPTWTVSAAEGSSVTYTDKIGNELVKAENGSFVEKLVEVATYDELVTALADGGKIKLTADITVDTKITAIDGTTIDLNSKTLYVNVENSYYNNVTIKNGNIVLGKDDVHVCDGYFLVNEGKALVVDGVKISSSEEGIKGYAVFHLKTGANLELINSELNISDNEYSAGYIVYAGEATATVDVVDTTVTGSKVNGIVHATTVIENSIFTITNAIEHGINRSGVTITNSEVAISGGTGRGITAQHGPLVIDGSSKVTITDMGEATIELRNNQNLTIAETATVTLDAAVNNTTSGTITGTVILPPMGNNFNGYIGTDAIWGEVWGNARESFVIKVLDANGNVMGTTSLNNIDGILDGDVNVTWSLKLDAASNTDEYWTMEWTTAPTADNIPASVELWVDGVKVSGGNVVLSGPDDIQKIYAATADENGKILAFHTNVQEAIVAAQAGDEIVLLADVAEDVTVPAGVIFNGNGKQVGVITAAGEITFKGYTKAANFGTKYTNTTINIGEGACLETTSGRLVIGYGCTFNITGTITDAKTADKANIQPSLIVAGASFTGTNLTFNVNNAYVKFNSNSTSKNSNANGTFNFNVNNSIWDQTGVLAFYVPTSGMDPTFNLTLKDSVLTTTSHLVFSVTKGEIVIDNSNVNVGTSRQLENRSTMTIKNGSVVNGAVATSSNAINPGTIIVEDATYAVTGQFSGAAEGTGTLVIKKDATVSVGSIVDKANVVIDATDMTADDAVNFTGNLSNFAGTIGVVNNDKLEAKIVDGKIVLAVKPVASVNGVGYATLAEAVEAAQAGDEIVLLADVAEDVTVPAGVIFNGNGKQVGVITAAGEITFKGYTKAANFGTKYTNTTINIGEGACLETTSGRLVIGYGCTFNITGTITDAKTADKANIQPSLIVAGASFTGTNLTFNVNNAYVKFNSNSTSKNSNANGTFNFNVNNSIWDQTGVLAFYVPTSGMDPTFNLTLKDSVLTTTSHLVFSVTKGEIVIDNSNVNVGTSRQLENRSTLTIKNGSVVYAAHATSSNAMNPGTTIVENATYVATGEFSGSDVGTGTLIVKNGANVTMGKITKANIVIDATGMAAGDVIDFTADLSALTGTIEVQNNDKLEAEIVDGKIVLKVKPVASINGQGYATLEDAFKAATEGCVIEILTDVVVDYKWDCRDYATNGSHSQFKESVTINGNSHTIMFTGAISDGNWNTVFRFEENATINNLTIDISEATGALRVITAKKSLTVDDLTIIGSARYGIIFGEGATATDFAVAEIVIRNSTLTGTRRAISDNEGGKDVKSIVITGNTLNANVYASASESIVFNNNTAASEVDLRSYTADTALTVEAQGNTLNTAVKNYILAKTITAQDEFAIEHPAFKVATKAELNAALAAAQKGDTIILTADIDYGTDQLKIEKAITLDLGGNTLTTRNAYGGISVKNNPTIKNGTIVHASNTAAIKVWNAVAFEDLVIDVQGKGDANKTIGGIVLQSSTTTRVDSIKNVTIKGAALTNGIETYNCGDATENVIGSMENVTINANGTGMIISAPCGTATGCTISGGNNAIEIFVKGTYSASLDLVDCDVEGGIFAHDEFSDKPDIVNNGTLNFTADAATTGVDDVTLTLARAENVEGILKDIKDNAQATVNNTYYATLEEAVTAAQSGDTIKVFAGTYAVPAMKAGVTIEGEVNADGTPAVLFEGTLSGALEDLTMKNIHIKGADAQRWAYAKGDLVFENVTFEATSVYALHFDGITEGTTLLYKDCTIIGWAAMGGSPASCVFDGCTIKDNGRYGVIRTYFDTTIENCTFNVANANLTDIYQDGIHAVGGAELVVDNCTNENGDMEDLVNISGTSVVVLDGVVIKNVAKIGDAYYETLAAAIEAADGDVVIELLADVTLTETLDITKPVTLGLNGYTITSTDKCAVEVSGGNKDLAVVIENGSIVASAIEGSSALSVYDGADVTLNNVALSGGYYGIKLAGYHSYPSDVNNNNLTSVKLKGGSVTAENAAIIGLGAYPNTQIDIDGTTVTSTDSIAIYHPSYGTLNITDGTITGTTAIYMKAGNLNISGGKFVANGEKADYEYENSGANATGDAIVIESCNYGGYPTPAASITGGTFTSANNQAVAAYKSADADAVIGFVKGGTFNTPVAEALCAVGYAPKANEDGTYGVRVKEETKFAAANLTIGVDLSVNFYVTGEPEVGDAVMNFAIPSLKGNVLTSSSEATEVTINGQTMWKFTFKGVGPHLMGKQLTATLVVEGITTEYKYSIQEYAMKELSRTAEDLGYTAEQFRVYREFLVNLLNYGAESQKYMDQEDDSFTISEEELVTYYLTEEQKAYMTHYHAKAPYEFANQKPQGVEVGKIVRLGTRNKIEILFRDATNAENNATKFDGWFVRVYGNGYLGTDIELKQSDKYADCYSIMIEDILVTYYDNNYEIFIYNAAGEQVGIIEYSIQEYVYNTQDTTKPAAALVKALWNYYHAAEDYIDEF